MSTPTEVRTAVPAQWGLLGAFCLLVALTQVFWLTYAPVTTEAAAALGVGEGAIGDLAVVNPLLFVLLALPAGRLVDRALVPALTTGALLTCLGAVVRALDPSSYAVTMSGQVLLSVAQPFVLTATTALAARGFPPERRTLAITAGSAAQFLGVLVGAVGGAPLVAAGGVDLLVRVHAALGVVAVVLVLLTLRRARVEPVVDRASHPVRAVLGDRFLAALAVLLFVGVGTFNAVATWLDPLLGRLGHAGLGGPFVALMTVAGVVGAAVLPGPAASRDRRRTVLLAATTVTVLVFVALAFTADPVVIAVLLALDGFVLLAGLPIALDWSELHVGPSRAGAATGALLLAGNLGGVVLVLLVQPFLASPRASFLVVAAAGLLGLAAASRLPRSAGLSR